MKPRISGFAKSRGVLGAICLGMLVVLSCADSPLTSRDPGEGWKVIRNDPLGFVVFMPTEPVRELNVVNAGTSQITIESFTCKHLADCTFIVAVSYPVVPPQATEQDKEQAIERGVHGVLADPEGRLVKETTSTVGGHPARAALYAFRDDHTCELRAILANRDLYLIGVFRKKGTYDCETRKFLDSFKLIDEPSHR
jgi:hypothetical protein